MKKVLEHYIFRGEWISPFEGGWMLDKEACSGNTTGIPIYKALKDVKNRVNQFMDGTHTDEPRIIGTAGWNEETKEWFLERMVQNDDQGSP